MAPSRKRCPAASEQRDEEEDCPKYDLFKLSRPIRPTNNSAVHNEDMVYNLFKRTPSGIQAGAPADPQNHSQHRARTNQPVQPKEAKQQKKSNPLGPRNDLRIAKAARLPKQATRQPRPSTMPPGSSANNPIAIYDKPASCGSLHPSNSSDPAPYYKVAEAPALVSTLQELIPPFDPASINTCPKPPSAVNLLDPEAYLPYQVHMSRHLAYSGVSGPYEIGNYLCDVQMSSGRLVRIAESNTGQDGEAFWSHLMTGERVQAQDGSHITGKPVALMNGALVWIENEQGKRICPEWTFNEPRPSHF